MCAYRQRFPWQSEAGGQLFGTVSDAEVVIAAASKPSRRDDRGRTYFRTHPTTAKAAIAAAHGMGLLLLGEWHTHAERAPEPSMSDLLAIRDIMSRSKLNTSSIFVLIRGTAELPVGLAVFLVAPGSGWQQLHV
jgi:integrative and conjugative element protein (TIGR02256 family)